MKMAIGFTVNISRENLRNCYDNIGKIQGVSVVYLYFLYKCNQKTMIININCIIFFCMIHFYMI